MFVIFVLYFFLFFFFKQKTAYEMRISDWSSDVCSSDLILRQQPLDEKEGCAKIDAQFAVPLRGRDRVDRRRGEGSGIVDEDVHFARLSGDRGDCLVYSLARRQIGRASCRERVCQYV